MGQDGVPEGTPLHGSILASIAVDHIESSEPEGNILWAQYVEELLRKLYYAF